jgi:hypothetical protein
MTDDLVKRLRGEDCANCVQGMCVCDIVEHAADRIEALEAALREIAQPQCNGAAGPDLHTCIVIARAALEGEKKDV